MRQAVARFLDSFIGRIVQAFRGFGRPLDVAVDGDRVYVTDAPGIAIESKVAPRGQSDEGRG